MFLDLQKNKNMIKCSRKCLFLFKPPILLIMPQPVQRFITCSFFEILGIFLSFLLPNAELFYYYLA